MSERGELTPDGAWRLRRVFGLPPNASDGQVLVAAVSAQAEAGSGVTREALEVVRATVEAEVASAQRALRAAQRAQADERRAKHQELTQPQSRGRRRRPRAPVLRGRGASC